MTDLPPPTVDEGAVRLTMKTHPIGVLLRMMEVTYTGPATKGGAGKRGIG